MEFRKIYSLIPESFRKKSILVALSLFLRALLDFAGVVVFIPVLARVLEKDGTPATVLPVAAAALAFIIVKGIVVLLLARYANKVNAVTMTFTSGIILSFLNLLSSVLLLAIILAALFIYEPLPTLALLAVIGPFMFFYSYFLRKRMKNLGIIENQARRDQSRSVFELLRGYPDFYVNGAVDRQLGIFRSHLDKVARVRMTAESYSAMSSGFMEITVMLSIIILMFLSMSASWGISMTFGIFALSAMKILPSVRGIVASWQSMQAASYSVDVLDGILSQTSGTGLQSDGTALQSGKAPANFAFRSGISLRGVSFRYDKEQDFLFRNLDLTIRKGEYVGIKGRSGVGKTTLFNLLMGFYTPEEGGLYVDDVLIGPDNVGAWQSLLGYVPQDVFLLNGTFVENVAFGQEPDKADRGRIERIFRKVGIWDWVSRLPQGMDTRIAEAGNSISGGQKQRIGIARALYKGASVLFFDEATSSVDTEAESEINRFVSELSDDDSSLTVIVIAHRRETLASCRRIIDLDL